MPELRRESRRVFGTQGYGKGSPMTARKTKAEQELDPEYVERANRQSLESFMAERRARIASKNRS